MAPNGRYYLTSDAENYTLAQLAQLYRHTTDWVERNFLYPTDSRTKKPLVECKACRAEFGFEVACPHCGGVVELVLGCPFTQSGNDVTIDGADLKLWLRQRAKARVRPSWKKYLDQLEAAQCGENPQCSDSR